MTTQEKPLVSVRSSNGLYLLKSKDAEFTVMDKFNDFQ
jgi:hypothetical protein